MFRLDRHIRLWMKWFPRPKALQALPEDEETTGDQFDMMGVSSPARSTLSGAVSVASSKGRGKAVPMPARGHLDVRAFGAGEGFESAETVDPIAVLLGDCIAYSLSLRYQRQI